MSVDTYNMDDQPQLYCPACGRDLSLAKHEQGATRPPQAGDQTVCGHKGCFTFLRYVEPEPGQLRLDLVTREEFEAMPELKQRGLMQVRGELANMYRESQPTRYEAALAVEMTALKKRIIALEAALGKKPESGSFVGGFGCPHADGDRRCGAGPGEPCQTWRGDTFLDGYRHPERDLITRGYSYVTRRSHDGKLIASLEQAEGVPDRLSVVGQDLSLATLERVVGELTLIESGGGEGIWRRNVITPEGFGEEEEEA